MAAFFGSLKGKVAFITGASGGIGAATALEFAKQGVHLSLHGRNVERLMKVQQQCVELGLKPEDVFMVTGKLVNADDVKKMAEKTLKYFGSLDILVNNAGSAVAADLDSTTFGDMDAIFHLHVKAPLQLVQLLKESITKNKGAIINVASIVGLAGTPLYLPYSIAKAAMIQLTANLNIELGPKGVRCNTVSDFMAKHNIQLIHSAPYSPQVGGRFEVFHKILKNSYCVLPSIVHR